MNPLVMWIWISQAFFVLGTIVAMIPSRRNTASRETARRRIPSGCPVHRRPNRKSSRAEAEFVS
jgi:hypothetical protein